MHGMAPQADGVGQDHEFNPTPKQLTETGFCYASLSIFRCQ